MSDFGPHGLPTLLNSSDYSPTWTNASDAISKAMAAAEAAGGGTVLLPRGTYFINSTAGFTVPFGVKLKGEGDCFFCVRVCV